MFQGQPGTKSTVKFEVASRATSARKAAMGSGTRCGASFDRLLVVALAGLLASLAGCVIAVGSFGETERLERSFDVDPSPHAERLQQLTIELDRGSVEVRAHDVATVRIEARASGLSAGRYRFEAKQDEDGVELTGRDNLRVYIPALPSFLWRDDNEVRVRVWVPRPYAVRIRTQHGRVDLSGIEGDVRVQASHGRVELTSIGGNVDVRTSHARLRVESVAGDVEIDTEHTPVTVSRIAGSLDINSRHSRVDVSEVSGPVRVRTSHSPVEISSATAIEVENSYGSIRLYDAVGPVYARNQHGSIEAHFRSAPSGELQTNHSRIEIEIPEGEGIDLDAMASHGRVSLGREIEVDGLFERDRILAQLNGGGDRLRVTATHGSIELYSR